MKNILLTMLLGLLLMFMTACTNPVSTSVNISPITQTYVQADANGDSCWWMFTEDGNIYVAEKYKISNGEGYMPVRHSRGTFTYNERENTINMSIYTNVRLTIQEINLYDSLAPILALPTVNSYDDSIAVCSKYINALGVNTDNDCVTDTSIWYRCITIEDTNYSSMTSKKCWNDTNIVTSCDGSDAAIVLESQMLPYYVVGNPDSWSCTYCQPKIAAFEIIKWDSSELILHNIELDNNLEGWGTSGVGLNDVTHSAYNETDDAGY